MAPTRKVPPRHPAVPVPDPVSMASAREAGLRYVTDARAGIARAGTGKGVWYRDARGAKVRDPRTLRRIRRLAIPPAWTQVWICPLEHGHIQATGRDARGRKQYRYHPEWSAVRDAAKFDRLVAFGHALPRIRRHVSRDLRRRRLDRRKVLAALVRLLETTLVRVGNEEYARQNHSFGLTTMHDRHVKIGGGALHFEFRGKSGRRHAIDLRDPRLARIVRQTQELPGQELFQYLDESGRPQKIDSSDVNGYLRAIAGEAFSAKDFRTWAGTVLAARAMARLGRPETRAQARRNAVEAIGVVASRLGNTPAVCRKCYIHPAVLRACLEDAAVIDGAGARKVPSGTRVPPGLKPGERAVLSFLEQGSPDLAERLAGSLRLARRRGRQDQPRAHGGSRIRPRAPRRIRSSRAAVGSRK